jgi:hypothetical protein
MQMVGTLSTLAEIPNELKKYAGRKALDMLTLPLQSPLFNFCHQNKNHSFVQSPRAETFLVAFSLFFTVSDFFWNIRKGELKTGKSKECNKIWNYCLFEASYENLLFFVTL